MAGRDQPTQNRRETVNKQLETRLFAAFWIKQVAVSSGSIKNPQIQLASLLGTRQMSGNAALMWEVEPEKCDLQTPNVSRAFKKPEKHIGSELLSDDKRNNQ